MNSNNDDIKTNLFYKLINDNLYNPILLNIISQNIINPTINKIKPYSRFKQGVEEKLKTEEGILEIAQLPNELSCNVLIENNGEKTRQEVEGNTFPLLLDLAFLIGDMIKKSEKNKFYTKWKNELKNPDPNYNVNLRFEKDNLFKIRQEKVGK